MTNDSKFNIINMLILKLPNADMAQSVEHVLGKDGVGSSNLPISSR